MRSDREILRCLSKNLRTLRKARKLSQEKLAFEGRISYKYLQELESCNNKKCPSLIKVIRLCEALGVSFDEILRD